MSAALLCPTLNKQLHLRGRVHSSQDHPPFNTPFTGKWLRPHSATYMSMHTRTEALRHSSEVSWKQPRSGSVMTSKVSVDPLERYGPAQVNAASFVLITSSFSYPSVWRERAKATTSRFSSNKSCFVFVINSQMPKYKHAKYCPFCINSNKASVFNSCFTSTQRLGLRNENQCICWFYYNKHDSDFTHSSQMKISESFQKYSRV